MTEIEKQKLGKTLWAIATNHLWGAMNADDYRDYMLAFLFLRYLSDNYEAAAKRELGPDYPELEPEDRLSPLSFWYADNPADVSEFSIVRLGFCMNNFLVLLTLRVRLTGLHS